ncbi:MAG: acetoacetate--CoA ligase [Spirosomataceae bacterium]
MHSPKILWQPTDSTIQHSNLNAYQQWLAEQYDLHFDSYDALWQWSVTYVDDFWASLLEYFNVQLHSPYQQVSQGVMPRVRWFEGATLNYAEYVFSQYTDQRPALLFQSERQPLTAISWQQLQQHTASLAYYLRRIGVKKGDRVVGYLPTIPEATVSLLATLSIGAIWSSASPDFGTSSVIERFAQIEPKVLIAVDGYQYGGKKFDKSEVLAELKKSIPSLERIILIPYLNGVASGYTFPCVLWEEVISTPYQTLDFEPVDFNHPIWVLYSSGTTGAPKAITHSQGGVLLEHLKYLAFHNDVKAGEKFFWYTTTGWMMWNFLNATLLAGATAVLYDGSPGYPDLDVLWNLSVDAEIEHFGTSAPFIMSCLKANYQPPVLPKLRSIGSTGSPLPPEGFDWIYQHVKSDVWLCSISGGTDICTAWVGGNPLLPVVESEIQCRCLGCKMEAFDDNGQPIYNEVGEMVVTEPMPSMPVFFWNDPDFQKYTNSYFDTYPGIWRHGDFVEISDRGSLIIHGRSDATLNRQGVRIGTAEIYRSVDKISEVQDSLIIHLDKTDFMPLFVVLQEGSTLTDSLQKSIKTQLRTDYSPRHVPDVIVAVPAIPYTISGKKMETPVKKILQGQPAHKAYNSGAMRNPEAMRFFEELAAKGF